MAKQPWEHLVPHLDRASKWLVRNGWLIGLPLAVCLLAAIGHIFLSEKSWRASQSIIVRDDLLGESFKPGRFNSQESLKNAQETVLYVARQPDVIGPALQKLGPPSGRNLETWIDQDRIEAEQGNISVIAPNGAEFGKTEVIVLNVRADTSDRARSYAELLAQQMELQLQQLRVKQLQGMQAELEQSLAQAQVRYDEVAEQVRHIEQQVGSDLSTLRSMIDNSFGSNEVHRFLEQIRAEARTAHQELESINKQLELLNAADSWEETIPTSHELLQMQPTLSRLYEGLAQAQLRASIESARYTELHPATQNHLQAVQETRQQIQNELATIKRGLESQLSLAQQKLNRLGQSERDYELRLTELGKRRVEYQVLTTELSKRGETLTKIRGTLFEIQSLTDPQAKLSLLTLVGEPQVDSRPAGLSKSMILLAAGLGGLLMGFGLVVLIRDPSEWGTAIGWCQTWITSALRSAPRFQSAESVSVSPPRQVPVPSTTAMPIPAMAMPAGPAPSVVVGPPLNELQARPELTLDAPRSRINVEPQQDKQVPKSGSLRQAMGLRPYGAGRVDNSVFPSGGKSESSTGNSAAMIGNEPEVVEADPVLAAEQAARLSRYMDSEPGAKPAVIASDVPPSVLEPDVDPKDVASDQATQAVAEQDRMRQAMENLGVLNDGGSQPAKVPNPVPSPRPRTAANDSGYTPTINLEDLRKSLENAGTAPGLTIEPSRETTPEPVLPKLPVESAEINVAKRLSELSKSIAAYCEPVRKKDER